MDHDLHLGFHGIPGGGGCGGAVVYPRGVTKAVTLISSGLEDSPAERWPTYERKLS